MSTALFVVQCFNGLQLGILLFLVAAGLTLVFGVSWTSSISRTACSTCWAPIWR